MAKERIVLQDEQEQVSTRFVSFMASSHRYELAILTCDRFNGKTMVIDLNSDHYGMLNKEDVQRNGVIEHTFHLSEMEAEELKSFLSDTL
ncbi:DUF3055 domain-containing protein [Pontibacillus litoralis]|uniref:DUF3055 domain-containing protein n=1 Tax=Pontibacillus litoralis JSM 072002 TaxID=1385512 RepID=A0A0A5G3S7_9BACI|nr:DUF3055 domain-containing protein [Pontibacillus litoralis]KGX86699.1 hypothetical protein N784_03630 [Pontibacillus litoralis JSM 072002]